MQIFGLLMAICQVGMLQGFYVSGQHGADEIQAILDQKSTTPRIDVTLASTVSHLAEHIEGTGHISQLYHALEIMQSQFFVLWLGTWPDAIDWTAAVMQTHVSSALTSISRAFSYTAAEPLDTSYQSIENKINRIFSQTTAYYFGQDAFAIRQQAHDDMLWVVLGWLEATRFVDIHSRLHHDIQNSTSFEDSSWHGNQFVPTLAHRAHVFYDIVHRAWDEELCGGGLTWNPQLEPYKNTVTNTQFISAAVQMYMYHPGDANKSPFITEAYSPNPSSMAEDPLDDQAYWGLDPLRPHDPRLLQRAIHAYDWLQAVDLRNAGGLYVDGYHVSASNRRNHTSTPEQCDVRNEMVYTYNQGIILSGLRSLWEATGNVTYLVHGHELAKSVIRATGCDDTLDIHEPSSLDRADILTAFESRVFVESVSKRPWCALGRAGIMQEFCDAAGTCSQDSQTFKGVFFHHFTHFCTPLPTVSSDFSFIPGVSHVASTATAKLHANSCRQYAPWVARNARAALSTRDHRGIIGGWWGVDAYNSSESDTEKPSLPQGAVDVWNEGIPFDNVWRQKRRRLGRSGGKPEWEPTWKDWVRDPVMQKKQKKLDKESKSRGESRDPNDRGRGRTVESHGSGLAVVRCMWELLQLFD